MPDHLKRRHFLQGSALAATGAALGLGVSAKTEGAGAAGRAAAGGMPTGKIGKLQISRLICGGNLISGWTHSRDLKYLSSLSKAYNTNEKVMETLERCEEHGINAMITASNRLLKKYWNERGGRMQWIAQTHPQPDDVRSDIRRVVDGGAVAAYVQGGIGDRWVKMGRVDLLAKTVEFIRSCGVPAGIGGHSLEVPLACEKAGLKPDFYMKTLHHGNYWSATPKDERVEFNVDTNSLNDHDNIWCIRPDETIAFMKNLEVPWIAFKVLAAGAIHPKSGFAYAFENGADFICVGMYDFQVTEDAIIARDAVARAQRQRPWRS